MRRNIKMIGKSFIMILPFMMKYDVPTSLNLSTDWTHKGSSKSQNIRKLASCEQMLSLIPDSFLYIFNEPSSFLERVKCAAVTLTMSKVTQNALSFATV